MDQERSLQQGEDWIWIEKIREGDPAAFEEIFNKYKSKVISLAFRFIGEKTAAEDIAQEVFIKIYEKKVRVDPKSKFSTWLYRVTVNTALDEVRKRKHRPDSSPQEMPDQEGEKILFIESIRDPKTDSPDTVLAKKELASLIQKEVDRLPEKFRLPMILYQFKEMSYREIAQMIGITEKAVEKRLYHAKEQLRKRLQTVYKLFK